MSTLPETYLTPEDYLAIERQAETKSEYYAGEMFAMAGTSYRHTLLVAALIAAFHSRFRGGSCRAVANDLRVLVSANGLYTYPDVVALCEQPVFIDDQADTLTNPTVIVEVLSPTTELYDRGKKFEMYSRLQSLTDYILVSQDRPRVEHFTRQAENQWLLSVADGLQSSVQIASLDCTLALADLYENVDFAPKAQAE